VIHLRRSLPLLILGVLATAVALAHAQGAPTADPVQTLPGTSCPMFPADNPWNQRVNTLPVAKNSAALIAQIGLSSPVHPDFGTVYNGAPNGIPYAVISNATKRVPVSFQYASESDGHLYPLPRNAPIEGGPRSSGDRHVIVVNKDTCTDYELFAAYPLSGGARWKAGSGAIFSLRSDKLRPAGWTSADAAGLPILAGLAIYGEAASGAIRHALRFTAPCTSAHYVYPARHEAGSCGSGAPPMGLRVRLKASVNISHLPRQARIVAQALKTYGMILADNGSPWYISGAPSPHWNDDALHELGQLSGRDFQVVDTGSLPHPGR
jgi:hypothetical protein